MGQGELLRELVRSLGWSYGVLWSIPPLMTKLVWTDGWYDASNSAKLNVERMFNSSYKTCSFAPGLGYVGKVFSHGRQIWLNGDAVHRNSITPGQATFFTSARIQTVLCFSWFNGVVELGCETSVPPNEDLLQQIRRFLSNSSKLPQEQKLLRIRRIQGSDDSSRFSSPPSQRTSSDDASGGGGASSLNQPVDSCSSLRQRFSASIPGAATSAPPPGNYDSICSNNNNYQAEGRASVNQHPAPNSQNNGVSGSDWRADFGSDIHHLTLSPTSTLQQVFNSLPGTESEEFETSSFLVSSASAAHDQAQEQQQRETAARTSTSSEVMSGHQRQIRESLGTKKMGVPAFKPWKGQKQAKRQKNQGNQVMLQRAIRMVHQISVLNNTNTKLERRGSDDSEAQMSVRHASNNHMEPREINLSHDEAAINHMLAERKRRERQKENFAALRALIPFVSKMDRASILSDAIQYVKQLKSRVQELEQVNRELEAQIPNRQRKPNSPV
ncbi:hypothetical protein R1flu_009907 [Riccia fluitans]|uniref:BHLH domain-containing protein n=1 Tax=Riccia fluitans TaxID=41844 RepID=A0ABD1Z499_9MARC